MATDGLNTRLLYEALSRHGVVEAILLERPESAWKKIRRRLRKLPFWKVTGQLFFLVFLVPLLNLLAKKRVAEIQAQAGYKTRALPANRCIHVSSVNDAEVAQRIAEHNPDFIFVNGTRIIGQRLLSQLTAPVLNIHVGITPAYRGIHGGYWALYRNDAKNMGVTLHYVDRGVDTGKIIAQARITAAPNDSFATYPILQFVAGLELVDNFLQHGEASFAALADLPQQSEQHYHPGFFQYLLSRWFRGIR